MRSSFDTEAEVASRGAARLMGDLYGHLEASNMDDETSSVFLSRMLFLMFGDDTQMWSKNIFYQYLSEGTSPDGSDLSEKLDKLFLVADTDMESRASSTDPLLEDLPYINGGIFASSLNIELVDQFALRNALLEASKFDWSQISPAVFGSMFQTVKSREDRRSLGEHYTSEENILKALGPLLLDDLVTELDSAWDDVKKLDALRTRLAKIKVLDPACGCGNFLIVAYRELREIELEILKRLRDIAPIKKNAKRGQQEVDATIGLNVTVEQFYGIEIEAWPARIAETAMFLVDHQANMRMEGELGSAPRRLPIDLTPHIQQGSALTLDWDSIVAFDKDTYIVGNPPYLGSLLMNSTQKIQSKAIWGDNARSGLADFVTSWFILAARYAQKYDVKTCFVSTNSITQGEQVGLLWGELFKSNVSIDFAHRTFKWMNEGTGVAAVHVVIIGFSCKKDKGTKQLWSYETPSSQGELQLVTHINPYLVDADDTLISTRQIPISSELPPMYFGSMPRDGGFLSKIEPELAREIQSNDPVASKYLRHLVGADELIKGKERYCLWLEGASEADLKSSPFIESRVEQVMKMRLESTAASTRRMATTPHLFAQIAQPKTDYIAVPRVSSESRNYVPMAYLDPEIVASDALLTIPDADISIFAVLMSSTFNLWIALVSGRLESRYRISQEITYNNFPLPTLSASLKEYLRKSGEEILETRAAFEGWNLHRLYGANTMPEKLRQSHVENDKLVNTVFDLSEEASEQEVLSRLFKLYKKFSADEKDGLLF